MEGGWAVEGSAEGLAGWGLEEGVEKEMEAAEAAG